MRARYFLIGTAMTLLAAGCHKTDSRSSVVAQRFVHKYGYSVSQNEWEANQYPGQVITQMRDGVTITASYEDGQLHGPCTHTFPDSQVVAKLYVYDRGDLIREVSYDNAGIPIEERVQQTEGRRQLTFWYEDGTPMRLEHWKGSQLLECKCLTRAGDTEAHVDSGAGLRLVRSRTGELTAREEIQDGYPSIRRSFFADGALESLAHFKDGRLHGEKASYLANGEPTAVEQWRDGLLHGQATYFRNGTKQVEIAYQFGMKNGLETHYVDGDKISHQISWENDRKHGPETFHSDGKTITHFYYVGDAVSATRFKELSNLDAMISQVSLDLED